MLAAAAPAAAHQPVVLTDTDATAAEGPVIPDGTVSFAVYGDIGAGGSQGFQVRFEDGDRLFVELLLPDLEPERSATSLPTVTIGAPDGSTITVPNDMREAFFEPFTGTAYIVLGKVDGTAVAGTYDIDVTSEVATRFVVSVGTAERFDIQAEDQDRPTRLIDVAEWYAAPSNLTEAMESPADETPATTSPPAAATTTTTEGASSATTSPPTATTAGQTAEAAPPTGSADEPGGGWAVAGVVIGGVAVAALVVWGLVRRKRAAEER